MLFRSVHQDGLVHISQLANRFVKTPTDVVKVGQIVNVRVVEINIALKRVSLSMKSEEGSGSSVSRPEISCQFIALGREKKCRKIAVAFSC